MAANESPQCTFRWKRFSLTAVQFYFNSATRSVVRVIGRIAESLSMMPRNRLKRSESSEIGRVGSFPKVLNNAPASSCIILLLLLLSYQKPRTNLYNVKCVKVFFIFYFLYFGRLPSSSIIT